MNIFYQLIGFGALIAMGLSYWQNDKRTILLWQVVANLIFAIHYTLLHACSGALCSVASLAALLPFFQSRRRVIQVAGIASGLSWLVYVIAVRSYSGMVTESVLTIITAASLLKKETRKP